MNKKKLIVLGGSVLMFTLLVSMPVLAANGKKIGHNKKQAHTVKVENHGKKPKPNLVGTVASISSSTITITDASSTTYTVDASNAKLDKTCKGSIADIKTGDKLEVFGTVNGTNITAKVICDEALEVKGKNEENEKGDKNENENGKNQFSGSITAVNGSSFTLNTKKKNALTVNTSASTTFEADETATTSPVLTVGEFVNVSGTLDASSSVVTATKVEIGKGKEDGKNEQGEANEKVGKGGKNDKNEQGEKAGKAGKKVKVKKTTKKHVVPGQSTTK